MDDLDAQWTRARLAHATAALARLQHDLRNMIAPSMLTAERLQLSDVPAIRRAGDVTMRGAERMNAAIAETLATLRDGLRRPEPVAVALATALAEAARRRPETAVRSAIASDLTVTGDAAHVSAALDALLAASPQLRVTADPRSLTVRLDIWIEGVCSLDRTAAPYLAICREYVLALRGTIAVTPEGLAIELPG